MLRMLCTSVHQRTHRGLVRRAVLFLGTRADHTRRGKCRISPPSSSRTNLAADLTFTPDFLTIYSEFTAILPKFTLNSTTHYSPPAIGCKNSPMWPFEML